MKKFLLQNPNLCKLYEQIHLYGWRFYDAKPVSERCFYLADKLLQRLPPTSNISPTSNNSIKIKYSPDQDVYIEINVFIEYYELFLLLNGLETTAKYTDLELLIEVVLHAYQNPL